jgi:2,4-dienoyl-CoA reductase-like NADH-dependent reductase (Old Yellow Enzyme family)
MAEDSVLFTPFKIGRLEVPGRVCKTATSETRASEDGFVTDELLDFYEPIARAGTPMIITGNLYVTAEGKSTYRMCGADGKDKVPGLKRLSSLVHGHGGVLFGQINHCGRQVFAEAMGLSSAVSASDVREKVMGTKPRPMSVREIRETVEAFAVSAECCMEAGFDGVQIHAGHGYLINQFLSPYTNRRRDEYGGSFGNRMRFLLEVYRAVRERVGGDYPLIVKIGGSDALPGRAALTTAELVETARILEEEGLDGVEVTVGHYESGFPMIRGTFGDFFKGLMDEGIGWQLSPVRRFGVTAFRPFLSFFFDRVWPHSEGFNTRYSYEFKKTLTIPVICVGGFLTRDVAENAVKTGQCDAVSVGRAMIADPYLYRHFIDNTKGPECTFCNGCIARAGRLPVDCYDTEVRKEKDLMLGAVTRSLETATEAWAR